MKKFFAIALIAASFVACNEGEKKTETETPATDSAAAVIDSAANAATATVDSAANAAKATVDSAAKAAVDSLKK